MNDDQHIWKLCRECAGSIGPSFLFGGEAASTRVTQYIQATAELLFGTAAVESNLYYTRQTVFPALSQRGGFSMWQVEMTTALNLLENIRYRDVLAEAVTDFIWPADLYPNRWFDDERTREMVPERVEWLLRGSDRAGVALARLKYFSIPSPIPWHDDREARVRQLAHYWKAHYNTPKGKGTVDKYVEAFWRLCVPVIDEDAP